MHPYYSIPWPIRLRVRLRLAASSLFTKLKALVGIKPSAGIMLVGTGNSGRLSPEISRHFQEGINRQLIRATVLPDPGPDALLVFPQPDNTGATSQRKRRRHRRHR